MHGHALTVHQNQYLVDIGFSPAFAAWMLGLSGLLRSSGSILWGALSDRMTRELSFTLSTLLGVVGLLCLLSAQTSPDVWRVVVSVLLMGLGYGGSSVIYSTAAADLFQGRHFGTILGLMEIGFGLGASLGSTMAGIVVFRPRPAFPLRWTDASLVVGIWVAARVAAVCGGDGGHRLGGACPSRATSLVGADTIATQPVIVHNAWCPWVMCWRARVSRPASWLQPI